MHEILTTKAWALEKSFFERTSQIILHRLEQGKDLNIFDGFEKKSDFAPYDMKIGQISSSIEAGFDRVNQLYFYEKDGNDSSRVAMIPAIGTMSKYAGLCEQFGAVDYMNMINKANVLNQYKSILLIADGPGGSVAGTTSLGAAINQSAKPVIAFVDGMAASAHYWVTSQANHIMGNSLEYTEVGSIGVLCMLMNQQEWLKKEGLEVKIMRAEQSVDKARLNSIEDWPEGELEILQQQLNQIGEDFISAVKSGRGNRLNTEETDIFTGRMFGLSDALDLGMIDYAGTLSDAIELASDVAVSRSKIVTN